MTKKRVILRHTVLALYIAFVFSNSLTPAVISAGESGFVLRVIHGFLAAAGIRAPWLTEHIIRKCAHFTEYTVLGILLRGSTGSLEAGRGTRFFAHAFLTVFIPFVDETLQLFTEGRSGQLSDVWLDMGGVLFGTFLAAGAVRLMGAARSAHRQRQGRTDG